VDHSSDVLRALRGGYELLLSTVDKIFLVPSLFNSRLLWNAADVETPATLFFPYYLADAALPFGMHRTAAAKAASDPWLVCKAIGDPSRSAMLRLLAERPRPASELMAELQLSKATVSEHIFQLRQAKLILEKRVGRSIELSIDRATVRSLGDALDKEIARIGKRGQIVD
jgi:DNA-binding transcriptional ArsR family regulator